MTSKNAFRVAVVVGAVVVLSGGGFAGKRMTQPPRPQATCWVYDTDADGNPIPGTAKKVPSPTPVTERYMKPTLDTIIGGGGKVLIRGLRFVALESDGLREVVTLTKTPRGFSVEVDQIQGLPKPGAK